QKQPVSQALEDQDQRISAIEIQVVTVVTSQKNFEEQLHQVKYHIKEIVRDELRELSGGESSLTAVAPALHDKHSSVVVKPYPYNGKSSWDIYYMQFENIARMNNFFE
ncbi:unnamed protein product, partial [Callosobruchus maculatus]